LQILLLGSVVTTLADWPPPEFPDMMLLFKHSIEMYGVENFEKLKRLAMAEVSADDPTAETVPCCVSLVSRLELQMKMTVTARALEF